MYIAIVQQGGGVGSFVVGQYPTYREAVEATAEHDDWLVPPFKIRVRAVSDSDSRIGG